MQASFLLQKNRNKLAVIQFNSKRRLYVMTTKDEIRRFIELVSEKTAFDENCLN